MKNIVVVVGMCGVGKSVTCDYLESLGYERIYFGAITFKKKKKRGIPATPESERQMRESLRKEHGMGVFAELNIPKIKNMKSQNIVVESLYSWDELKILQNEFGKQVTVIAIVADKDIRYERLSKRILRPFTKEEAKVRDISEIENIAKAGPIAYADYFVDNNGTILDLHQRIDTILGE